MYLIDQRHLETLYYGSGEMGVHLQHKGHPVNRKRAHLKASSLELVYIGPCDRYWQ